MNASKNPFHLKGYYGPNLFCDRKNEVQKLTENIDNDVNTTLFSIRRMGKTGLIHHLFHKLKTKKTHSCIYVDIYATQSLSEFTNQLASAILNEFPENKSIGSTFLEFIKGLSPIISYDAFTGTPQITFSYTQNKQYEYSLKGLFSFLDKQNKQIVIAIDEFQQIVNYPEKNTEAILRTIIQSLKNVTFIFSGSHKHLLSEIFNSAKRPFFSSTQSLYLDVISEKEYAIFIKKVFVNRKRKIDKQAIEFILQWTKKHTYYTQALCNKIFAQGSANVTINQVYKACDSILEEQENIFFQYRNLLTSPQWKLLKAIAKEDKVYQPTGIKFISTYQLGNPASVKRSLESLVNKEMVYKKITHDTSYYQVYDCFLSRWLER